MAPATTVSCKSLRRPSQCSEYWRVVSATTALKSHSGMMSELPIVPSSGRWRLKNLTGLNGSIRPGPQSGRESIQAKRVAWASNADPTAGINK